MSLKVASPGAGQVAAARTVTHLVESATTPDLAKLFGPLWSGWSAQCLVQGCLQLGGGGEAAAAGAGDLAAGFADDA
jgi:hypothetical protein